MQQLEGANRQPSIHVRLRHNARVRTRVLLIGLSWQCKQAHVSVVYLHRVSESVLRQRGLPVGRKCVYRRRRRGASCQFVLLPCVLLQNEVSEICSYQAHACVTYRVDIIFLSRPAVASSRSRKRFKVHLQSRPKFPIVVFKKIKQLRSSLSVL